MFEVTGVTHRYDGQIALAIDRLSIEDGETLVLLGPSGGGKTTLLKLLLGLLLPEDGAVLFRGQPLSRGTGPILRRQMGYVAQGGGLFPHLTAAANVTLPARHEGWDRAAIAGRLGELASLVRLNADALHRFPAQLSGGQAQRVGLMRALMLDPAVLLLDEPLGALDPVTRLELQADLRGLFSRLKKTVVMVTHDLREAEYFSSRVVLMGAGKILQQGRFVDLLAHPADPLVTALVAGARQVPA